MNANDIVSKWNAQADVAANLAAPVIDDQLLAQVQGGFHGWMVSVSAECMVFRCDFWNR